MERKRERKSSWFIRLMWVFTLFTLLLFSFSLLAGYVKPDNIWWLSLFGLAFPPLFLLTILLFLFWTFRRRRRAWFVLIFVLAGIIKSPPVYRIPFKDYSTPPEEANALKVMSFNVRLFNLYNWFHNTETKNMIFSFLQEESPDVICFQEFYSSDRKDPGYKNDSILRKMLSSYSHIEYTLTLRNTDHWGIATYSKYPIIQKKSVRFQEQGGNIFIYTDIVKGKDTIRVFNTHLESIRFKWEDYKFIENLGNDEVQQDELEGGIKILRKLKRAFVKRAGQVAVLHDTVHASPYPVILCGDFNDVPSSYAYRILADDLKDSFLRGGRGFGTTYAGPFPNFRIDYIFHDKRLQSYDYKTHRKNLSDHYAISCTVVLP